VDDPRYADVVAQPAPLARAHVAGKTEPTPERWGRARQRLHRHLACIANALAARLRLVDFGINFAA